MSAYGCPLHFIKARQVLKAADGEAVRLCFADLDLAQRAADSLEPEGYVRLGTISELDDGRAEVVISKPVPGV